MPRDPPKTSAAFAVADAELFMINFLIVGVFVRG
jgi:hypothetical protein